MDYADFFEIGSSRKYVRDVEAREALAAKAPLASPTFTGTPRSNASLALNANDTQLATTAHVYKHTPIHLQVTANAGSAVSKNDSRITATMRVINAVFGTPSNVTSNVTWTTAAGTISFTGTFVGTTTIDFDLVEVV